MMGVQWFQNIKQVLRKKGIRKVFVVLDEAQHDFDAKFCSEISPQYPWYEDYIMIQVFRQIQYKFKELFTESRGQPKGASFKVTNIYSGTSLRMDEMIANFEIENIKYGDEYKVHSDFPLLRCDEESKRLLDEGNFNAERGLNPDQLKLIENCGCRLRGRYLWITLYIDQLKSLTLRRRILDKAATQKAANDVTS